MGFLFKQWDLMLPVGFSAHALFLSFFAPLRIRACAQVPPGRPRGDGAPRCMGAHEEGV